MEATPICSGSWIRRSENVSYVSWSIESGIPGDDIHASGWSMVAMQPAALVCRVDYVLVTLDFSGDMTHAASSFLAAASLIPLISCTAKVVPFFFRILINSLPTVPQPRTRISFPTKEPTAPSRAAVYPEGCRIIVIGHFLLIQIDGDEAIIVCHNYDIRAVAICFMQTVDIGLLCYKALKTHYSCYGSNRLGEGADDPKSCGNGNNQRPLDVVKLFQYRWSNSR